MSDQPCKFYICPHAASEECAGDDSCMCYKVHDPKDLDAKCHTTCNSTCPNDYVDGEFACRPATDVEIAAARLRGEI